MYKTGELESVMESFEEGLKKSSIYIGCEIQREPKVAVEIDGRIQKRFLNGYYSNGRLNDLFVAFLAGYALGKTVGPEAFE